MGDKRTERSHAHLAWKARIMELELGDRKTANECDILKVGNSSHRVAISAKAKSVKLAFTWRTGRRSLVRSVQDASTEQFIALFGLDGEVTVAIELMNRR